MRKRDLPRSRAFSVVSRVARTRCSFVSGIASATSSESEESSDALADARRLFSPWCSATSAARSASRSATCFSSGPMSGVTLASTSS